MKGSAGEICKKTAVQKRTLLNRCIKNDMCLSVIRRSLLLMQNCNKYYQDDTQYLLLLINNLNYTELKKECTLYTEEQYFM